MGYARQSSGDDHILCGVYDHAIVSLKIMGASFFADFEKQIADENSLSVSLFCAATLIGLALILSSVVG